MALFCGLWPAVLTRVGCSGFQRRVELVTEGLIYAISSAKKTLYHICKSII